MTKPSQVELTVLLEEYKICNDAYSNRDSLIQEEFGKIASIVSLAATVLAAAATLIIRMAGNGSRAGFLTALFSSAFVFFLLVLLPLHRDLCATASTKKAVRRRAEAIEDALHPSFHSPLLWNVVANRPNRFKDEWFIHKLFFILQPNKWHKSKSGSETDELVVASRVLLASVFLVDAGAAIVPWLF